MVFSGTRCATWGRNFLSASVVVGALLAEAAVGQTYDQWTAKVTGNALRDAQRNARTILRDANTLSDAQKKQLQEYFFGYYFPVMTDANPEALADLADHRERFLQTYLNRTKSQQARDHLVAMTISAMGRIALGNYHPAARYNAILLLGMLDEVPAGSGANATPPTPLPKATNVLVQVLTRDAIKEVRVPTSAKVGALVGLERHARFGIDEQNAPLVTKAAMDLIAQAEPPADVSKSVHHWMKCQAARVLTNQYANNPTPEVQTALNSLIANEEMSLDDRCCAAKLMSYIDYTSGNEIDVEGTVLTIGNLANAVMAKGAKTAKDFETELFQGGGGQLLSRPGGMGLGRGGAANQGPKLQKRPMLARMRAIVDATESLAQASDEIKTKLTALTTPMQELIDEASKKDAFDETIIQDVEELAREVASIVAAWQPAAAEPAPEAAVEEDFSES